MSEVEDGAKTAEEEQREVNNLYPLMMHHNGGRDSWNKGKIQSKKDKWGKLNGKINGMKTHLLGTKDSLPQGNLGNMVSYN